VARGENAAGKSATVVDCFFLKKTKMTPRRHGGIKYHGDGRATPSVAAAAAEQGGRGTASAAAAAAAAAAAEGG
jgi:hypothetical protein